MSSDLLIYEKRGPVVQLTINRAETRNPLGEAGDGDAFVDACNAINADKDISCAILTGAGKAFSAGGNLKAMRDRAGAFAGSGTDIRDGYRNNIHRIIKSLWALEVPLLSAVNGPAIGLGNDVACLGDVRISSDKAIFGATFLKIGLIPGDGGAWLLPRIIGHARASELLFSGRTIDAATALDWGLVSRVVPHDTLMDEANALAADICAQPPAVLRMTKKLLRQGMSESFDGIMELSAAMQAIAHHTEDHAEAVNAFLEKRKPTFTGK